MNDRSIILLGGPDSGKTNYVGRLWHALDAKNCGLIAAEQPTEIGFVLDTAEHLFQGRFAPRSEFADARRDFEVAVCLPDGSGHASIKIPDISGELWQNAVAESEIDSDWMNELDHAHGALLFVRVGSDLDVRPLDWVTAKAWLAKIGDDENRGKIPTQIMLCELVRYLELTMAKNKKSETPRLSVIVAAWDRVDSATFERGPVAYLQKEYPLLAGRLADTNELNVQIFGLSVVGGDLEIDPEFRDKFLETGMDSQGWVAVCDPETDVWRKDPDLTLPIAWAVGE